MKRTIRATAPTVGALSASTGPPAGPAHANAAHVRDGHDLPTGAPEHVAHSPDN
ncbi:hypothetical protein ACWEBX_36525 [Streptomyces sp. NPDC005070]